MKPSLFALFFLFSFIASSAKAQLLVDSEGNNIINGGTYYILPYIWALGGGLRLAKTGNETCPLSVVQSRIEVDNGLPWTISSPLKILYITPSVNLNFFSVEGEVPSCVPLPSTWTIVEGEDGIKSVKISGYENTLKGWFRIQLYNRISFKIVFCPINADSCGDIAVSDDRRLVVISDGNTNRGFVFVRVKSSEVSEKVINNVLEA